MKIFKLIRIILIFTFIVIFLLVKITLVFKPVTVEAGSSSLTLGFWGSGGAMPKETSLASCPIEKLKAYPYYANPVTFVRLRML